MKELSIEEKAKRYDEALANAKYYHSEMEGDVCCVLEECFPQLKESEDEKIRKEIIDFINRVYERQALIITDEERDSWIAWLEGQGEQKPFDYENANLKQKDYSSIDPHFYKPIDKVEPRFHKDEWIITKAKNLYQVTAIIDNKYQLKYGDNYTVQKCADVDKNARLWDINKDAKDGDVLSDGTTILIFKDLLSDGSVMSYCDYDTDSGESDAFCPFSMNLMCSKITPAAKEQSDTLMKAMTDAGYTFDFEKKELKETNPPVLSSSSHIGKNVPAEWSAEDEKNLNAVLGYIDDEYLRRWLKDVIHAKYDKPAWSEEDKNMIERLILSLSRISANTRTDSTSLNYTFYNELNWLKSLKDRYTWKPSEEQMDALETAVSSLQSTALESLYNKLKKI